ncbi:hypothetical protein DNU06_01970 [Putridiphycobacter roseus]|uniref:DUF3857 domain-containing protein n=1 Tax=Putridiphycobacter roseus TaxID=2219161 RepID=A0A2W1N624_9FLAO|nr:DUF3857 domain-containing protein [Putridiphycobacter roseus]PZE18621.1 hypothetical protein DNU06_01970 [Putridiphycobacter roseus]
MNKFILTSFLLLSAHFLFSQNEANEWATFETSIYEVIEEYKEEDAVIIFDRLHVNAVNHAKSVDKFETFHRKIKINSQYGLEQFNTIYIPSYSNRFMRVSLVDCKLKTINKNNQTSVSDTSNFEITTLPANVPFFYKKKGKVKMLVAKNLHIGDELEYVYTIRTQYDVLPEYYYDFERIRFSSDYFCLEKTVSFESPRYETKISPYNFHDNRSGETDFTYADGVKITLKNIRKNASEIFANDDLDQPYIYFYTAHRIEKEESDWKHVVQEFNPTPQNTKKATIFDGESLLTFEKELNEISNITEKFELILERINAPMESSVYMYKRHVEDDMDIALAYAYQISRLIKRLQIPTKIYFVVDKSYGKFAQDLFSLNQFTDILFSFKDENGKERFMPVLKPFSKLDYIPSGISDVECLIINQSETGKKLYSIGKTPAVKNSNHIKQSTSVTFNEIIRDSLHLTVDNQMVFEGESFIELSTIINFYEKYPKSLDRNMRSLIDNEYVMLIIDSLVSYDYVINDNNIELSFQYYLKNKCHASAKLFEIQPEAFFDNHYYTAFSLRENRTVPGYLYDKPKLTYNLKVLTGSDFQWMENTDLKYDLTDAQAVLKMDYSNLNNEFNYALNFKYNKDHFQVSDWDEFLNSRDMMYISLSRGLYFSRAK